jgi:hypothetical protein
MDKLAAAGDALFGAGKGETFGERYDDRLARQRAIDEADKQVMKGSRLTGQATGLLATAAVTPNVTLARGTGLLPQAVNAAATGAAYGGAGAGIEADGTWEQKLEAAKGGAKTGALVGAAVPLAMRAGSHVVGRAVTPLPIDPARQAAVDRLEREIGTPVSAGQRSGNTALKYAESYLGDAPLAGGQASAATAAQAEGLTDAAVSRMGGAGGLLDEVTLNANRTRIGQVFDDLSQRNTMFADAGLGRDISQTLRRYQLGLEPQQSALIRENAAEIARRLNAGGGRLSGTEYQVMRSELGRLAQSHQGNNNTLADAFRGLRNALDNTMDRSIAAHGAPGDMAAWREARRQWGNYKTLLPAGAAGGETAASGLLTPAQLRVRATSGKNADNYALGRGDFTQLSKDANQILSPLPNSGTAQRTMLASQAGAAGSALVGAANPALAAAAVLGPAAMGRALWSGPIQAYLKNNVITPAAQRAIEARLQQIGRGAVRAGVGF